MYRCHKFFWQVERIFKLSSLIFKWFIPVVCDYNIKYQNYIKWVSQNTTLYYGERCQKIDNMFRPFSIRPKSGLTWWNKEEKITMLLCNIVIFSSLVHHVRPDDGLIEKGRNMLSIF